jgi:3-oxoacyl-[acyl-carrier protein] reductase
MPKTALITGATRGIGRTLAHRMADLGHNLFLLGRDAQAMAAVVAECSTRSVEVAGHCGELTDESFASTALEMAENQFGGIDILINNAGAGMHQAIQDADLAAWRALMAVNFDAVVYLTSKVLPGMISRGSGAVINISSISGRNSSAGSGIYSASKAALNGLGGSIFEDVREHGIKVSTIMPGFVETDLTRGHGMDPGKMIRTEDVADSVEYVLSASANCCPTEIVLRPQRSP